LICVAEKRLHNLEATVNTFLNDGDVVFEISRDLVITNVWYSDSSPMRIDADKYLGRYVSAIRNDDLIVQAEKYLRDSFSTNKKYYFEKTVVHNDIETNYGIKILREHPDQDFLLAVVQILSRRNRRHLSEETWRLVLDASGDGMWDADLETGKIYFSEKWHELFGYEATEITTIKDWRAKIHPDDLAAANKIQEEYFSGRGPYSVEIRYLCKDGHYRWILSRGTVISKTNDGKPLRFIGTHTDINKLKETEEKYQNTSRLLSNLVNNLHSGILVTEQDNKIIFANKVFCDIYGISEDPAQLVGKNISESLELRKLFFKDQDFFISRTKEIIANNELVLNEEWELKSGKTLSRDYIPVTLDKDKKGGIWQLRDITEQYNTEKRFEQQRLFYERILNHIAADIVVFDAQYRYLFLNPTAIKDEQLRKWMIGKTDFDYCRLKNRPLSIAERRKEIIDTARNERHAIEWEERLVNTNGEVEYHLRNLYPVFNESGEMQMAIGYGLNITDRKLAEEALKTSQETFASAFDYSGVGMALLDAEGNWVDANKVLCQMTGYSKEELLKLTHKDITFPEDVDKDATQIAKMLRSEISTYTIEKRYVSKDHKIVLASLTVSLVWNPDDTPKFFIAQAVDITKRKELENEINRRNTELESARENLINKVTQLEEVSHIIAHNLRGPAGNIKMLVDILQAKNKDEEHQYGNVFTDDEVLELIGKSSTSLMNNLATLMEITEIKLNQDIPFDNCEVRAIINGIKDQLQSQIYEKRAVIAEDLKIEYIKYPRAYLENILYNLISNALKYSRRDVIPEILISTRKKDNKVQIVVKDNGLGIDLVKYGHKMFKLNQVFHEGYDSKGVGLYIIKSQIESFGGTIEVRSKVNEGCEFIVTFR
jgi:PAS domain S-box-containing protein